MKKIIRIMTVAAALPLLAGGCTMAPRYVRPGSPVPAAWTDAAPAVVAADSALAAPRLPLATFLPDEKLRAVVDLALANNRDLRLAALNLERTRQLYKVKRNELLPAVQVAGYVSRQHDPASVSMTGSELTSEYHSVDLGVSGWELDFFGRVRSLKNAALEQYLATAEARRSVQQLLQAQVAGAYLTLAADQTGLVLADSTLASQTEAGAMLRRRHAAGLTSEIDVRRAETQEAAARDAVARARLAVAQDRHLLDLLAGTTVPDDLLPRGWASVLKPTPVAAGVVSDVLLARPDVMAAEHQLKASYANVGAARATFFPRISLTSLVGTASNALSGLFAGGSGSWTFAGQAALPIFDTRTIAAAKASGADRDATLAQYERTVQRAFREVNDALARQAALDEQVAAQQALLNAAEATFRLAQDRYAAGLDSYLSVLDAQRSLFSVQQGVVAVRLGKYANLVNLYAVMGGGDI